MTHSIKSQVGAGFNPIVKMLFMGMTMKAWIKYAKYVSGKIKSAKENNMEYIPSESDEDDYVVAEDSDLSEYEQYEEESGYDSDYEIKEEDGEESVDSVEENEEEITEEKQSNCNLEEEKDTSALQKPEDKTKERNSFNAGEGQSLYPKILYNLVNADDPPKENSNQEPPS